MAAHLDYRWHLRTVMADRGMFAPRSDRAVGGAGHQVVLQPGLSAGRRAARAAELEGPDGAVRPPRTVRAVRGSPRSCVSSAKIKSVSEIPARPPSDLVDTIGTFIDGYNDRCHPFTWTEKPDTILSKAKRSPKTEDSELTRH